jgi:hypothetical protein
MISEEEEKVQDRIRQTIEQGSRAERAYTLYVHDFIAINRDSLFEEFCNGDLDSEELMKVQATIFAFKALEIAIKADIDNGDFAQKQLDLLNKD